MLVFKGFVAVSLFFNCQKQEYSLFSPVVQEL